MANNSPEKITNTTTIHADSIHANIVNANTIHANTIHANVMNANQIYTNANQVNPNSSDSIHTNIVNANTIYANTIHANTVNGNTTHVKTLHTNTTNAKTTHSNPTNTNPAGANPTNINGTNANPNPTNPMNPNPMNVSPNSMNTNSSSHFTSSSNELTEEEAKVYDRQLRLWGVRTQFEMRKHKILVYGLDGLACEVLKNLVLAGIGSVCIADAVCVTESDLASQFFVKEADVGRNRAEASLKSLQELNPLVSISIHTNHIDTMTESFISQFNSVYLNGCTLAQQLRMAKRCRDMGIQFFTSEALGLFTLYFQDLGPQFQYTIRDPSTDNSNIKKKRYSTTYQAPFPSFEDIHHAILNENAQDDRLITTTTLGSDWKSGKPSSTWLALIVLQYYRDSNGSYPSTDEEFEQFILFYEFFIKKRQLEQRFNLTRDELIVIGRNSGWAINPVCSVVGGVIAQEIIKSLSRDIAPIRNFLVYDAVNTYSGYIEPIGVGPEQEISRVEIAQGSSE